MAGPSPRQALAPPALLLALTLLPRSGGVDLPDDDAQLLFFDHASVASTHRVSRTLHQPAFDGVALRFDEEWEDGGSGGYNSVVEYSPTEQRIYYSCAAKYEARRQVCLAVSHTGGRTWHKPVLGVATFRNSTQNNIVFPISCTTDCEDTVEPGNVWEDRREGIPASERWKLFVLWRGPRARRTAAQHLWLLASPDGIAWRPLYDRPSYAGIDDTETTSAGWNAALGKYLVFIRDYTTVRAASFGPCRHTPLLRLLSGLDRF